jgi:hypothetical protein
MLLVSYRQSKNYRFRYSYAAPYVYTYWQFQGERKQSFLLAWEEPQSTVTRSFTSLQFEIDNQTLAAAVEVSEPDRHNKNHGLLVVTKPFYKTACMLQGPDVAWASKPCSQPPRGGYSLVPNFQVLHLQQAVYRSCILFLTICTLQGTDLALAS